MTRIRAIDALVNSSFLAEGDAGALSYLFKDLDERPQIKAPEDLLQLLDAADLVAAAVSIMGGWPTRIGDFPASACARRLPGSRVVGANGGGELLAYIEERPGEVFAGRLLPLFDPGHEVRKPRLELFG